MTCRYIFSRKEYVRAVNLLSWIRLPRTLFWLGILAVFIAALAWSDFGNYMAQDGIPTSGAPRTIHVVAYFLTYVPAVLLPSVLMLPPVWTYLNYISYRSRGTFAGKELSYTFGEDGIQLQSDTFRQANSWDFIGRAREGRHGFLLTWGKSSTSFHWIPKSALETPEDIVRFRELIARHIADFRPGR